MAIRVQIIGDSSSLERAFKRAGIAGQGFSSKMRTVARYASVGFAGAMVGVAAALRTGFNELAESQKVAAQTRAVLKSTGGVAGVTAKSVDKLASSLSRKSGIDDEAIASAENMLLTFTSIRNEAGKGNKIFDSATKATLDMATALGLDLPSAAMMVGKALNQMDVTSQGNVRGFMALRRVGVQVTPEMMKMAAAFIRAGKPLEAQKLLLQELQTEFGGSAEAYGTTMPGALGRMRNAFDEVAAAFASGFLPAINSAAQSLTQKFADPAFVERVREIGQIVSDKVVVAFRAISAWFKENWGGIKEGFSTAGKLLGHMNRIARKIFHWFSQIASITPGGEETLIGMIAGGLLLRKLMPVGAIVWKILKRLRLIAGAGGAADAAAGAVGGGGKGGKGGKGDKAPVPLPGKDKLKGKGSALKKALKNASKLAIPLYIASEIGTNDTLEGLARKTGIRKDAGVKGSGDYYDQKNRAFAMSQRIKKWQSMGAQFRQQGQQVKVFGPGGKKLYHTFDPGEMGYNKAVSIAGDVHLHGVQNPKQMLSELQRIGKHGAGQTRGRHGGQKLALG